MEKRKLSKIPRPVVGNCFRWIADGENARYLLTADRVEDVLILNFFRVSGKEHEKIYPDFRVFCQKDDYISQDLTIAKVKWRKGSFMYLCNSWSGYSSYWWSVAGITIVRGEKLIRECIYEFAGIRDENTTVMKLVEQYQDKILKARLEKKHKKETDVIDSEMEKFGPVPDDYQEFAEKVLFADDNYMFYSKAKGTAYCSKCGFEFDVDSKGHLKHRTIAIWNDTDRIRHNKTIRCPYCNNYLEAKSEKMGRGYLTAVKWSILVEKYENEILVRYFCHVKDFEGDYKKPNYYRSEQLRTIHTEKGVTDYEWGNFKNTGNRRWIYQKIGYNNYWSPSELVLPRTAVLYNQDIDKVVEGTCMRYSCAKEYLDYVAELMKDPRHRTSPFVVDHYFNYYRRNNWTEQLIKCGFTPMVYELQSDYSRKDSQIECKRTILETLGITRNELKLLRSLDNAKFRDVEICKYFRETIHREITKDEFSILRYIHDYGRVDFYKYYVDFMKYSTLHKLNKYLNEQPIDFQRYRDYFEYIEWIEELGYDMRNEFNLFPKSFIRAHDQKAKEYQAMKDKKNREDIERFNQLLKTLREEITEENPINIKSLGLFIRLPYSLDELTKEGEALHHCVGTYKDKVAKGKTHIYFVRKLDEPDKSYYTLEWQNQIVQCRGSHNCDMTPEVKAFVELFNEKMQEFTKKGVEKDGKERKAKNLQSA